MSLCCKIIYFKGSDSPRCCQLTKFCRNNRVYVKALVVSWSTLYSTLSLDCLLQLRIAAYQHLIHIPGKFAKHKNVIRCYFLHQKTKRTISVCSSFSLTFFRSNVGKSTRAHAHTDIYVLRSDEKTVFLQQQNRWNKIWIASS